MKHVNAVAILLLLVINVCCGKQIKSDLITIDYEYGDGEEILIIGTDSGTVDIMANSVTANPSTKGHLRQLYKFVLTPEALNYLGEYVNNNCSNDKNATEVQMFDISIQNGSEIKKCLVRNRINVIKYFNGFVDWSNNSKYNEAYKPILPILRHYIRLME